MKLISLNRTAEIILSWVMIKKLLQTRWYVFFFLNLIDYFKCWAVCHQCSFILFSFSILEFCNSAVIFWFVQSSANLTFPNGKWTFHDFTWTGNWILVKNLRNIGSISVSWQLCTYPFFNPTCCNKLIG